MEFLLSVSTQEIKKDHWHRADSDTSGSYVYLEMRREKEEETREYRKSERERGEARREIYLPDPRALFVAPLSKDEALEAFAQTAAS